MADKITLRVDGKPVNELRVVDLKKELEKRGMSKSGSKKELVERLKSQLQIEKLREESSSDDGAGGEAPKVDLEHETNPYVKKYMEQRKAMLQTSQEQKRKVEEEKMRRESESHSASENEDARLKSPRGTSHTDNDAQNEEEAPELTLETKDDYEGNAQIKRSPHRSRSSSSDSTLPPKPPSSGPESQDDTQEAPPTPEKAEPVQNAEEGPSPVEPQAPETHPTLQAEDLGRTHSAEDNRSAVRGEGEAPQLTRQVKEDREEGSEGRSARRTRSSSSSDSSPPRLPSVSDSEDTQEAPPPPERAEPLSEQEEPKKADLVMSGSEEKIRPETESESETEDESGQNPGDSCKEHIQNPGDGHKEHIQNPGDGHKEHIKNPGDGKVEQDAPQLTQEVQEVRPALERQCFSDPTDVKMKSAADESSGSSSESEEEGERPALTQEREGESEEDTAAKKRARRRSSSSSSDSPPPAKRPSVGSPRYQEAPPTADKAEPLAEKEEPKEAEVPAPKFVRKRKWGSTRGSHETFSLSTASLKAVIPDIKVAMTTPPVDEEEDDRLDYSVDPASENEQEEPAVAVRAASLQRTVIQDLSEGDRRVVMQEVRMDIDDEDSPLMGTGQSSDDEEKPQIKKKAPVVAKQTSLLPVEEPQRIRPEPAISRNPLSRIIHIVNLTRPFTAGQLKELLTKYGSVVQTNGFWMDNIKTNCMAMFETEDQAKAARTGLHGTVWPSSNPKILRVDYASERELKLKLGLPVEEEPAVVKRSDERHVRKTEATPPPVRNKEPASHKETQGREAHIREWDRDKIRQSASPPPPSRRERDHRTSRDRSQREPAPREHREHRKSRERRTKAEPTPAKVEQPVKLLDDLFQKTKTTPCIYWLPLVAEEAEKRAAFKAEMEAKARRQLAEREQAEEEERQKRMEERKRREKELEKEREKEREIRRKELQRSRDRSRRRSTSSPPRRRH